MKMKEDPEQTITYVDNGPKKCMNYLRCYSSVNGIIRRYKLDYTIKRLNYLSQAYILSNDLRFAEAVKKILLKLADRFQNIWFIAVIHTISTLIVILITPFKISQICQ